MTVNSSLFLFCLLRFGSASSMGLDGSSGNAFRFLRRPTGVPSSGDVERSSSLASALTLGAEGVSTSDRFFGGRPRFLLGGTFGFGMERPTQNARDNGGVGEREKSLNRLIGELLAGLPDEDMIENYVLVRGDDERLLMYDRWKD